MKHRGRISRNILGFGIKCTLMLALLTGCGGGGDSDSSGSTPAATTVPGSPPAATTLLATSLGATGATLNGIVSTNGLETVAWFEYGTDPTLASSTGTPPVAIRSDTASLSVNSVLSGLTSGTTYYFRVASNNISGITRGSILSFSSDAASAEAPAVTTLPATSVGGTTATLNGSVTANGHSTNAWFEVGVDPSFTYNPGFPTLYFTPSQSVGSGTTGQSVTADITGLRTGVTYYYRIVATNDSGTSRGSGLSLGPFGAPIVTTLAATSVGATGADLNGIVIPNGMGTTAWFEYGTDPTLASFTSTSSQTAGSGVTSRPVNAALSGLIPGDKYYFRVAAGNSSGATKGKIASVTIGTTPGQGEWTATGTMVTPRSSHTATLLPNGRVLITGGFGNQTAYLSSSELYDPLTGTWRDTGSMGTARIGHTATLLPNGKVLVAGGEQYMVGIFSSAELYDPSTGTWTNTESMGIARVGHTATLLPNGKVLVAGGKDGYFICTYGGCSARFSSSAELYDPATGTWVNTGSMGIAHASHNAILLQNGKVLVEGGGWGSFLATAELYDPASGTWDDMSSHALRGGHTATLLPDGKVLVTGGYETAITLPSAELYDPVADTWVIAGSLAAPRIGHTATVLHNGKVLVAGGGSADNLASTEIYSPDTDTWENTGVMVAPRIGHTTTVLHNGKVLVAGGNGTEYLSAEVYNP